MRLALAACLALLLAPAFAPAAEEPDAPGADGRDDHVAAQGDLRLIHAWTRATRDATALVFVEIENTGASAATLTGAEAAIAAAAELVAFRLEGGEPGYAPLPELPVAPGTGLALAPEGLALRLTGLEAPLVEGARFPLEVLFAGGPVEVVVEVEAAGATQHGHAGHAH